MQSHLKNCVFAIICRRAQKPIRRQSVLENHLLSFVVVIKVSFLSFRLVFVIRFHTRQRVYCVVSTPACCLLSMLSLNEGQHSLPRFARGLCVQLIRIMLLLLAWWRQLHGSIHAPSSERSLHVSELGELLLADSQSMDLIEANDREGRSVSGCS